MRDPSSLNEWSANHEDWVLPFYTSRLVDGGPSMLLFIRWGGLSSQSGFMP